MIIGPLFLVVFFKSLISLSTGLTIPLTAHLKGSIVLFCSACWWFFYSLLKKIMCFYCTKEIPREKHNLLIDANNTTIFHIPPL